MSLTKYISLLFATISFMLMATPGWSCDQLTKRLRFCGGTQWTERISSNKDAIGAYRRGANLRLNFLLGDAGTNYGSSTVSVLAKQLDTYSKHLGVGISQIPILDRATVKMGSKTGRRIVFSIKLGGHPFVVAITAFVGPEDNLQIVTVDLGTKFTRHHKKWHTAAIKATTYRYAK